MDDWFYGLLQSASDLIALMLTAAGASNTAALPSLSPDAPGDALYRFEAPELKTANHRLDGAFWPRSGEAGTPERPVLLLEVQMLSDPGFQHQLLAQTARFLQLHPPCSISPWFRPAHQPRPDPVAAAATGLPPLGKGHHVNAQLL